MYVVGNPSSNALEYGAGKPFELRQDERMGMRRWLSTIMASASRPRIGAEFSGVSSAPIPENDYGGFGLALWMSQQIVESLGGISGLESQLGVGSTFTVELPSGLEESG